MKRYQFLWDRKPKASFSLPLGGTIIFMLIMIIAIVSNTHQLDLCLEKYAETYTSNVSTQLAKRTASSLLQGARELRNLAATFSRMPDEVLSESLLEQKKENMSATRLFILNEDSTTFPENEELSEIQSFLNEETGLSEMTHISYLDQNQIIYSTPFVKDGQNKLLISIFSGKALQEMIEDFNFEDTGRCCIVDRFGNLIIPASDMQPFRDLKVVSDDGSLSVQEIQNEAFLSDELLNKRSGNTILHSIDNRSFIVNYKYLGICNWMLITIMPQDMFSATVAQHLNKFIMVAASLILVAMIITISIIRIYRKNLKHIKAAALTDTLTGGDNINAMHMRGEYILSEFPDQLHALVYLNNKDFKSYNIRFGINGGNSILLMIYNILNSELNEHELLARCDGSSFCLLIECTDEAEVINRVNKLCSSIKERLHSEYSINNYQIAQGAYLIRSKTHDFLQMQDWAKLASSYETSHEECKLFDNIIVNKLQRENELDAAFDNAIKNNEFKLYVQPKISPADNRLSGGEILVRWEHPEYGLIPPNEFIPLFEKNGKICTLDFYMFEETCKLLKRWIAAGFSVPLSVNLSRAHMGSQSFDFLDSFKCIKEKYQIPDNMLELELTESMTLERHEVPFVLKVIDRIKLLGFGCSLDDFGYGYSSLTLLKDLNITTVKLDHQFFRNESEKAWIIIGELIQMAHKLNISVVAEGIEKWDQVERLKHCGCDQIQGYIYAKPMDSTAFPGWAEQF